VVLIRDWLCSASRAQQPNRPVSGIPASPAANRRILASFPLPASRAVPCRRPPAPRVTHPAKKTLPVRHPMSGQHRNQLKKNGLKGHD
jgi:hypothetical protein